MPSVSVPLRGEKGWTVLMQQRRDYWKKGKNAQLTSHFVVQEFYCNDGSPVPILARPALVKLCEVFLEPLRTKFGVCLVLSGYRHTEYNSMIGGALYSQHIYEESFQSVAADVRFPKGTPAQWAAYARGLRTKSNNGNGGVGRYDRAGFIHVDSRPMKVDWSG